MISDRVKPQNLADHPANDGRCGWARGWLVAAFLGGKATPVVVIVFTFLEGIVWALNGPVFLAVVPSLVPKASLDRALALNSIQFNMARLCGADAGGGDHRGGGSRGGFHVKRLHLFFHCLECFVIFSFQTIPVPPRAETTSMRADIHEGLAVRVDEPMARGRLTIMGLIFMFLRRAAAGPAAGCLRRACSRAGPGLFGLMLSAIGLGSILGAFLLSLHSLLLSAPPSHPTCHVHFRGHRDAVLVSLPSLV